MARLPVLEKSETIFSSLLCKLCLGPVLHQVGRLVRNRPSLHVRVSSMTQQAICRLAKARFAGLLPYAMRVCSHDQNVGWTLCKKLRASCPGFAVTCNKRFDVVRAAVPERSNPLLPVNCCQTLSPFRLLPECMTSAIERVDCRHGKLGLEHSCW